MSICKDCFHSYVCEQFNEHRNSDNKSCHWFHDHFVSNADVAEVTRCKDCKLRDTEGCFGAFYDEGQGLVCDVEDNDFCSYGERKDGGG